MDKINFSKLPKDVLAVLRKITDLAADKSVSVWLVGGMVRDILLGQSSLDIDVVIEGDGVGFSVALAKALGASVVIHRRFGTAVLDVPGGLRLDVVTARRETYARPGALPDVIFGQIADDLFRRDFTLNAIAVSLNKEDLGVIRDDFDSLDDINKGLVRIMHYRSFVDDPTRILRAVRYEKRFHFRIEPRTLSALRMACHEDAFVSITPVRYFGEFKRVLQEIDPVSPLRRLRSLDGLRYFSFGPLEEKLLDKIVKSQCTTADFHKEGCEEWIPRLAGLLAFVDDRRADELLTLFNVTRRERQGIMQFLHFLSVPDMLVRLRERPMKNSTGKRSS